ncbi:MAG: hypothetical protein Q9175_007773 [Cornicularia normoerica]
MFNHMWILQRVMVAQNVVAMLGERIFNCTIIILSAEHPMILGLQRYGTKYCDDDICLNALQSGISEHNADSNANARTRDVLALHQTGYEGSLFDTVSLCRCGFCASDPQDQLCSWGLVATPDELRTPDCSRSPEIIYTGFAINDIEDSGQDPCLLTLAGKATGYRTSFEYSAAGMTQDAAMNVLREPLRLVVTGALVDRFATLGFEFLKGFLFGPGSSENIRHRQLCTN